MDKKISLSKLTQNLINERRVLIKKTRFMLRGIVLISAAFALPILFVWGIYSLVSAAVK